MGRKTLEEVSPSRLLPVSEHVEELLGRGSRLPGQNLLPTPPASNGHIGVFVRSCMYQA
jgi:hypothetical protein